MGLKELRSRRGLTQVQLSELTGLKQQAISEYERGVKNVHLMSLDTALKLAEALHCSPGELVKE
ncbi:MAG: helix-turn-helix transcriptional regulator [Bifidobacterium sp.]|nr:helix-turn-helix transcriptional regulator [Bifidobacterium sp.]